MICVACKEDKPLTAFQLRYDRPKGVHGACKACRAIRCATWRAKSPEQAKAASDKWKAANPERVRAGKRANRLKEYGLTTHAFESLLAEQKHLCLICRLPFGKERRTKPVVDHDHTTGKVRGILCVTCNSGIGLLKDDARTIQRAALYLLGIPNHD